MHDKFDTPGVKPWSWTWAVITIGGLSLGGWAAIAAILFATGILQWP